jgi:hypothetical protein
MTKKHFIALANLIRVRPHCFSGLAIESLADFCADQNPQFNRQRWLDYIHGKCGANGGKVKHVA